MKRKQIFRVIVLLIVVILSYPGYIFIQTFSKDYVLGEYLKHFFIPRYKKNLSFSEDSSPDRIDSIPKLHIEASESSLDSLRTQIDQRLIDDPSGRRRGTNRWKYIDASITDEFGNSHQIKLRIRGDGHANYNNGLLNASYRFNTIDSTMYGKKKLSLVKPFLENHRFYGYLYYKFFKKQHFITPDFDFVKLQLNNDDAGLYILQEGFSDELIGAGKPSAKGILFRFKNDCMDESGNYNLHTFPELDPYNEKIIGQNPVKDEVLRVALLKYNALQDQAELLGSVLDLKKYAQYMAFCDLLLAHHSHLCQNVKLFFNQESQLFEPVSWDPGNFIRYEIKLPLINKGQNYTFDSIYSNARRFPIHNLLSKDSVFLYHYSKELYTYLNNDSLLTFVEQSSNYIRKIEPLLYAENYYDEFNPQFLEEHLTNLKAHFNSDEIIRAMIFTEDSSLQLQGISKLPIYVENIVLNDTIIQINTFVLPNQKKLIKINKQIKDLRKFDLTASYLYPYDPRSYKGRILTKQLYCKDIPLQE